ncbi:MAG TPA: hypothetical protein VN771_03605 [Candidatus Baltobacteraceae bacterium]|nr:hypothetical protein [Candidatus Baltobacteraceae bacterium]
MTISLALLAGLLVGACAAAPTPDPSAACNGVDAPATPGYYPALESLLPTSYAQATPSIVNSGRFCTAASLGSLAGAGISDLHFAGAQFPASDSTGVSLLEYAAPSLTPSMLADAFTAGAASATDVNQIQTSAVTVAGRAGVRIQVNNQDVLQVLIFWPSAQPGTVNGILASGVSESAIQAAIQDFGNR